MKLHSIQLKLFHFYSSICLDNDDDDARNFCYDCAQESNLLREI